MPQQKIKILSISKPSEINRIKASKKKFHAKSLILLKINSPAQYLEPHFPGHTNLYRSAYIVTKAVGNAVIRNKAKRRLRACFLSLIKSGQINASNDYLVIAKREIANCDYKNILSDLKFCSTRIDKIIKS